LIGYIAYTGREHGCAVHSTRVHGPCSRPVDTGGKNATVFTGRAHGSWIRPVNTASVNRL